MTAGVIDRRNCSFQSGNGWVEIGGWGDRRLGRNPVTLGLFGLDWIEFDWIGLVSG